LTFKTLFKVSKLAS